jgi:hypothetical protein
LSIRGNSYGFAGTDLRKTVSFVAHVYRYFIFLGNWRKVVGTTTLLYACPEDLRRSPVTAGRGLA